MFDRFSAAARQAVVTAHEEARARNQYHVGPEHLLLGIIRQREGVGAKALSSVQISVDAVREQVEEITAQGRAGGASGHIGFTSRSEEVLVRSLNEADQLGQHDVGTAHILLALIREGDDTASQILVRLGVELIGFQEQVIRRLHSEREAPASAGERSHVRTDLSGPPQGSAVIERTSPAAQMASAAAETVRLRAEITRLRALLSQHGIIDPGDDGGSPS